MSQQQQTTNQDHAQTHSSRQDLDFSAWSYAVRQQMLASLAKRRGKRSH
jgi:hypothetical protein